MSNRDGRFERYSRKEIVRWQINNKTKYVCESPAERREELRSVGLFFTVSLHYFDDFIIEDDIQSIL